MKTRMGFISNSSSSNFVMVGYYTDDNLEDDIEVTEFFKKKAHML